VLEFAFAAAAVFIAAFTQGLIGFGSGIIALALLALIWDIQQVVAITSVFSIVICIVLTWRLRRHIVFAEIRPLLGGAAFGIPLGVIALLKVDAGLIRGVLGLLLVFYVLWSLRGRQSGGKRLSRKWAFPVGFCSGLLTGAFNTGGPPAVIYGTEREWGTHGFRANIQSFFTPCAALALYFYIDNGIITSATLNLNLQLFVFLLLGMFLGDRLAERVNPELFRRIILGALFFIGLFYTGSFF
jgi:hypothetical protein